MLETVQIWFISDNVLGLNLNEHAKKLKIEPHKADKNTRSLYSIIIIMSLVKLFSSIL